MNQQGLMFTLEVMIALVILAVAIGVVFTGNHIEIERGDLINLTNQSHRITAVYFNDDYQNTLGETTICGDYWEYPTGSVIKNSVCEGYT